MAKIGKGSWPVWTAPSAARGWQSVRVRPIGWLFKRVEEELIFFAVKDGRTNPANHSRKHRRPALKVAGGRQKEDVAAPDD